MAQLNYKRSAEDRDLTFRRPSFSCHACHDTGILVNGDGLLNDYLPDYDRAADGRRLVGSDLALACHCTAAYPVPPMNGRPGRGGLREPSGAIRLVDGIRAAGADPPRRITEMLQERRLANWRETERAMSEARQQRASGQAEARPWFLIELRQTLMEQARRAQAEARSAGPQGPGLQETGPEETGTGGLQPIAACLASALAGPGGPLADAETQEPR